MTPSPDLTPDELSKLRTLAEAAPEGPWHAGETSGSYGGRAVWAKSVGGTLASITGSNRIVDATTDFIAAAHPQTVLTLIRMARETVEARAVAAAHCELWHDTLTELRSCYAPGTIKNDAGPALIRQLRAERDALKERVEELSALLRQVGELPKGVTLDEFLNPPLHTLKVSNP